MGPLPELLGGSELHAFGVWTISRNKKFGNFWGHPRELNISHKPVVEWRPSVFRVLGLETCASSETAGYKQRRFLRGLTGGITRGFRHVVSTCGKLAV